MCDRQNDFKIVVKIAIFRLSSHLNILHLSSSLILIDFNVPQTKPAHRVVLCVALQCLNECFLSGLDPYDFPFRSILILEANKSVIG